MKHRPCRGRGEVRVAIARESADGWWWRSRKPGTVCRRAPVPRWRRALARLRHGGDPFRAAPARVRERAVRRSGFGSGGGDAGAAAARGGDLRSGRRLQPPRPHPGAPGVHGGHRGAGRRCLSRSREVLLDGDGRRPCRPRPSRRWRRCREGWRRPEPAELPGVDPALVTTEIALDADAVAAKRRGLAAHATQVSVSADGSQFALSNYIAQPILDREFFVLVGGTGGTGGRRGGREDDLFAGVGDSAMPSADGADRPVV